MSTTSKLPSLSDLLQAGAHFGHPSAKWHPKMRPFLFGARNGVHIINLDETRKGLEKAMSFAKSVAQRGGSVLFVGTKRQASAIVEREAKAAGMPFVSKRWLGGTLTNFSVIAQQIRKLKDLKRKSERGELAKYTKLEQLRFSEEIEALEESVGGIQELTRIPEAVFIFDLRKDKTALEEARRRGVKIIAVCDSNVNPTPIDFPIPSNDDAVKAIELVAKLMGQACAEGRKEWEAARARLGGALVQPAAPMKR